MWEGLKTDHLSTLIVFVFFILTNTTLEALTNLMASHFCIVEEAQGPGPSFSSVFQSSLFEETASGVAIAGFQAPQSTHLPLGRGAADRKCFLLSIALHEMIRDSFHSNEKSSVGPPLTGLQLRLFRSWEEEGERVALDFLPGPVHIA